MDTLPLEQAYVAAHETGAVVERPGRGLVRLTGPQRIWFLQNTITNDVEDVPEGRWVESCFLDVKGHVVAHFRVGVLSDELWLDVDPPGTNALLDWFVRYRFRTKVEIEDVSRPCLTVLGASAVGLAADGVVIPDGPAFGGSVGAVATVDLFARRAPHDLPPAGTELYEVLRVEAGFGAFGVDYGPANLPQEAGLTRIVSVTKGCYVGQEVMARLHFRGHANRSVRAVTFRGVDGDPVGRELLRGGERAGTVTSAVVSPTRGPIGIAMVRLVVEPDEVLDVAGGGTAVVGPVPEGTKRDA